MLTVFVSSSIYHPSDKLKPNPFLAILLLTLSGDWTNLLLITAFNHMNSIPDELIEKYDLAVAERKDVIETVDISTPPVEGICVATYISIIEIYV